MKPETIKSEITVSDADGRPIRTGSVIQHIDDNERGVVIKIYRPGDHTCTGLEAAGDMAIRITPGTTRITNIYEKWKHIPPQNQTYTERWVSWYFSKQTFDEYEDGDTPDQQKVISAIRSILALDSKNPHNDHIPRNLEDSFSALAEHLDKLSNQSK